MGTSARLRVWGQIVRLRLQALGFGRLPQLSVEGRQGDGQVQPILSGQRRRQMDGVVAAQSVLPGQVAGVGDDEFGQSKPGEDWPVRGQPPQ